MIRRISELLQYRELLGNLVIRDLKVRYKNSVLGVLWSLLNPLLMTVVFTLVFTLMIPSGDQPYYPVFFMCGYLPWSFFQASVMGATGSIANIRPNKTIKATRKLTRLASDSEIGSISLGK